MYCTHWSLQCWYSISLVLKRKLNANSTQTGLKYTLVLTMLGGTVASWLARSTPERALRIRALAGDIVLCSWARHLTLTVPLSTQVYKWVPANLMLGGNPAMD